MIDKGLNMKCLLFTFVLQNFSEKKTIWRKSMNVGTIIEFSKKDSTYFGLIEIDHGIRILGEISCSSEPNIGQSVKMIVSLHNKPHFLFIVENN